MVQQVSSVETCYCEKYVQMCCASGKRRFFIRKVQNMLSEAEENLGSMYFEVSENAGHVKNCCMDRQIASQKERRHTVCGLLLRFLAIER